MKIAIIPARIGSKRIKKKNIKNFCGKPIIYWPIKQLIKTKIFDVKDISPQLKHAIAQHKKHPGSKQKYHAFFGYRVATDSDLASKLYDKCSVQSMCMCDVFLDKKCLKDGEPWEHGFSAGLVDSQIFNPIMTWHGTDNGSVGQLLKL